MRETILTLEPFKLISVISFSAFHQVNNHGRITLTGLIQTEKRQEYLQLSRKTTWVKVSAIDEKEEKKPVFIGILERLTIESVGGSCVLSLTASSGTKLMDFEYHTRSFQGAGISYREMIDICNEGYPQAATIMTEGKGERIPHFCMQYRENDWEFIKRLASSLHTVVVPSYKTEGVKYFFGVPEKRENTCFEIDAYKIEQDWGDYEFKKKRGLAVGVADSICYVVQSREIYELGSNVVFDGRSLYIWKIETIMKGNELVHSYFLKTKSGFMVPEFFNEKLIGLTLLGRTTGVKGETIQLSIASDENEKNAGYHWFQYSTVYSSEDGTGWYCMPEEGDAVRLYFPTEDEADAYAISAVHEKEGSGVRTDPRQKIWKNKEGKEIRLSPDQILLTNNDGMSIELNDQKGIRIHSDKSIYLSASETISINSDNAGLEMSASNKIILKQGDSKMVLGDGIQLEGAKIKLE